MIIQEGISDSFFASDFWTDGNYISRTLADVPSNAPSTGINISSTYSSKVSYWVFRGMELTFNSISSVSKYLFVHEDATVNLTDTRIKYIGGTEWIEAMKEVYETYKDKWFCRIIASTVTDDGYDYYTDDSKSATAHAEWSDAFVDYDIFGVDRV